MSKDKKRLVPVRRFKEFENATAWEQRKLGEISELNGRIGFRGYTVKDIVSKEDGGILTFSPTNIINNSLEVKGANTYITKEKYEESPEIKVDNGDILFVKTGSTLGKSALVSELMEPATINPQIVIIRSPKHLIQFLSVQFITNYVQKQITAAKIGGAVPTLTEREIKKFKFYIPNDLDETRKIGQFFSKLDSLITLHQRKLDKLKRVKSAYLTEMFPAEGEREPKRRFPGFTGAWEQRKLSELIQKGGSGGTPKSTNKAYYNGNIPFLGISDISKSNGYIDDTEKYISEKGLDNSAAWIVPKGAISLAMYASVGKLAILNTDAATSQAFYNMVFEDVSIRDYVYHRLGKANEFGEWTRLISTGTQSNLNADKVKNFKIQIPQIIDEIKNISTFFNQLDSLIALYQRKLDKLKNVKDAYLNEMFV